MNDARMTTPDTQIRIDRVLRSIETRLRLCDDDADRIGFAKGEIMLPLDIAERLVSLLGLLNEVLEEAELVDDDNCYGYLIGAGIVRRLHEVGQDR